MSKKQGREEGLRDGWTVEEGAEPRRSEEMLKQRGLFPARHSGGCWCLTVRCYGAVDLSPPPTGTVEVQND